MTDTLTAECRSENMRRIRSTNTTPEISVRRLVYGMGFRYRLHVAGLPGKPDMVFGRLRKVIEVRGCFWHQHGKCIESHVPKSRREYWLPKLKRNVRRDAVNLQALKDLGFDVLIVWECEITRLNYLRSKLRRFLER